MPIRIEKAAGGYIAEATPPHVNRGHWETTQPMGVDEIIEELLKRGAHQTDIGDAFYSADPNWLDEPSS